MKLCLLHRVMLLTLGTMLGTASVHAQGVYKWTDADGKTHYGSQPPTAQAQGQELKLHSNTGFGGDNNSPARAAPAYNSDGTKKIPKDTQELADGMLKALKKVDPKPPALDCTVAVGNIHYQADLMLEVGQKNVKDGYLTQAAFDANASNVQRGKSDATVGDCVASTGAKRAFYQCMTSERNHVTGCASKHKP